MAWRFKASKYKNAAPIVPKPEGCIRDIVVGSYQTYGNNIAASAAFMAFNWEHTGSSVAVLPLDDFGRKSKTMPLLHAHTDTVTDLEFSPFHDGILATASQDCLVKVWHIPEKGLEQSLSDPECSFSHKQRRVETVGFHPTADCLLYSTAAGCVTLFDLTAQKEFFSNNQHPEVIQSLSWKQDGTICATSCKDKMLRIIDPRNNATPIVMTSDSHQNIKDSRIVWMGNQNRILTTGFDAARLRQVIIRDVRNLSKPEKTLELDCSTGILMPLYDPDTNMLLLAGKGDTTIAYLEVTDKDPYFIEGIRHSGEQTKGACLVPKRALRVMEGEVNRVMQLTSNMVIPIMYQVPRKTYRDFHTDLYPDTTGYKTELTPDRWQNGINLPVPKMSLDPVKRELGDQPIIILRGNLQEMLNNLANQAKNLQSAPQKPKETPKSVPIKHKIQHLEQQQTKAKAEVNEFEQKFKNITSNKEIKNSENECLLIENSENNFEKVDHVSQEEPSIPDVIDLPEKVKNGDHNGSSLNSRNGSQEETDDGSDGDKKNVVPPKPLPRTSISDQGSFDESSNGSVPRPKPRTATTGYKPRLGPKPFSSEASTDFSFDKVFAVPQFLGNETIEGREDKIQEEEVPAPVFEEDETNGDSIDPEISELEQIEPEMMQKEEITETEAENEIPEEESMDTEFDFKVPSTAERRKIFERKVSAEGDDAFDGGDEKSNFDRLNANRNSIAERRRMYESRSQSVVEEKQPSPTPLRRRESCKSRSEDDEVKRISNPIELQRKKSDLTKETVGDVNKRLQVSNGSSNASSKRTSTVFGKVSKFRHLKGTTGHKSTHVENIKNLSRQISGECDGFHANYERVAVPLQGGGKIAIFELSKGGRLQDGVIPSLLNGCNIMDFAWDPFDTRQLAVGVDDGCVKLWKIPEGGLVESTNTPDREFVAHSDKIYFIKFHPLAKNVLLTASYDMTMKLWDLETMTEKHCLRGHTDQIFGFAWSPCGNFGATVCKDGKLRVYNLRKSDMPIREGIGPVGTRGARISYAMDGEYIVVTGFDKVSERQIYVYKVNNLQSPIGMVSLDVSPAILIPYYDADSSTLFVTGKGDSTIYAYEVTEDAPYLCPLSHHRCSSLHQGLSFLPKNQCDVTIVEFAKCLRLTSNSVEPLSFTVPRLKTELFQDDLFPPTQVTWTPTMVSSEWFAQKDKKPKKVSLQPEGMETLSSIQPVTTPTPVKKIDISNPANNNIANRAWTNDLMKTKQEEIKNSVSARLEVNLKLEQDDMEGVDEHEWNEE